MSDNSIMSDYNKRCHVCGGNDQAICVMGILITKSNGVRIFNPDGEWYPMIECNDCGQILQEFAERSR